MTINSKLYDILKWVGTICLPALAVLYSTVGKIWGLDFTEEIPLTIMAVDVFLNALLGISSANYYKKQTEGEVE